MERKLLVTDLDGTLLDENKLISEPSREVLQAWVDGGNVLAIGTGRVLSSALAMRKALGLESLCRYVIACNGAQIYDAGGQADPSGSMLFERTIPFGVVEQIIDLAEAMDVHCHTYLGPYIVARRMTQALDTYRFHMHMPLMLDEDLSNVLKMDPPLMLAIEMKDRRKLEALQAELGERFPDKVMALFSSHQYLDILPAGTNKGNALSILANSLDIPMENTLAAGDEENDISMIEAAGLGIAMRNGTDRIKALADIVTEDDNTRDGLAVELKKIMERSL